MTARHLFTAALLAAAGALFITAGAGCSILSSVPGDRLLTCKSNDDCKNKDPKKPNCANLRCVECAYDSDCESGLCTDNRCKTLFKSEGDSGPEGPPQNLDACLSRCNDAQECVNKCHEQFKSAPEPGSDSK